MASAPFPGGRFGLYRLLLIGAGVLAALTSAQHYVVMQLEAEDPTWRTVQHAVLKELPFWLLWVLAAPLVALAVRRIRFERRRLPSAILAHVALAVLVVLAHGILLQAIYRVTHWPVRAGPFWTVYLDGIPFRMTIGLLAYLGLFGSVISYDYYQRYREREVAAAALAAQLAEARLQTLRMQLNPHFLFNAMNSIAMLVRRQDNAHAVRMLAGLSELLRTVLEETPQEVPLERELGFVRRYLEIERQRFADRLRVAIEPGPGTQDALVPSLILQPLVENAVKHGIALRTGPGTVTVTAERRGEDLVLEVRDDGAGAAVSEDRAVPESGIPLSAPGIGVRNTSDRLTRLYGERGTFQLEHRAGSGTVARVTLPYHTRVNAAEVAA